MHALGPERACNDSFCRECDSGITKSCGHPWAEGVRFYIIAEIYQPSPAGDQLVTTIIDQAAS